MMLAILIIALLLLAAVIGYQYGTEDGYDEGYYDGYDAGSNDVYDVLTGKRELTDEKIYR